MSTLKGLKSEAQSQNSITGLGMADLLTILERDTVRWTTTTKFGLSVILTFHLGMLLLVTGGMELNEPAQ